PLVKFSFGFCILVLNIEKDSQLNVGLKKPRVASNGLLQGSFRGNKQVLQAERYAKRRMGTCVARLLGNGLLQTLAGLQVFSTLQRSMPLFVLLPRLLRRCKITGTHRGRRGGNRFLLA